jgi:hypothetical protein
MAMNVGTEDKSNKEHKKKLTKVLSTKLSIDEYDRFRKRTDDAYRSRDISKPSVSEFLRFIVIHRSNKPSIIDLVHDTN